MRIRKSSQKGFTVVETLLVTLVFAMVGFGGYYVWHNQQNNSTEPANTTQTDSSLSSSTQNYLIIKEWGVRMKTNPLFNNLSYKYTDKENNDSGKIIFTSSQQDEFLAICQSGNWGIYRFGPNDPSPVPADMEQDIKIKDSKYIRGSANFKKVGDYWYQRWYPQGSCDDPKSSALGQEIENAFINVFDSFEISQG